MTDREWPEYPNQSGGETVTGPESAQEEAASERGWERIRRPPLQRSANRKRVQIGSGPPRRHRKKSLAVSAGKIWDAGPGAGAPGGRAFLPGGRLRAFPNHRNIGLEARNGILRG